MNGDDGQPLQTLEADWSGRWEAAMRRDPWRPEYRAEPWHNFGDRDEYWFDYQEGELLWIPEEPPEPEGNEKIRARIEEDPDRYEELPPLEHDDHHDIFASWLEDSVVSEVREACETESIGGFFDTCRAKKGEDQANELRWRWEEYSDSRLKERAEAWLRDRGWQVEWR